MTRRTFLSAALALCGGSAAAAPVPTHLFPRRVPRTYVEVAVGEDFMWSGRRYRKTEIESAVGHEYVSTRNARAHDDIMEIPLFANECPVNDPIMTWL